MGRHAQEGEIAILIAFPCGAGAATRKRDLTDAANNQRRNCLPAWKVCSASCGPQTRPPPPPCFVRCRRMCRPRSVSSTSSLWQKHASVVKNRVKCRRDQASSAARRRYGPKLQRWKQQSRRTSQMRDVVSWLCNHGCLERTQCFLGRAQLTCTLLDLWVALVGNPIPVLGTRELIVRP